jgi:hypothetical protein
MTGYVDHNFPNFDRVRDVLLEWGDRVYSPADIARRLRRESITGEPKIEDCARADIAAIFQCDTMFMLKGWERSIGARAEHALAVWLSLEISYEL